TGAVLGGVKMALQPLVVLFRSLHGFTSQADPQQIEEDGRVLEEGGKEIGGALGGLAGSLAGGDGKGGGHHEPEETPPAPTTEPTPPPASRAVSGELEIEAVPAPGAKPPAAAAPPEEGFVDIGTDPGLRAVRDEINATAE